MNETKHILLTRQIEKNIKEQRYLDRLPPARKLSEIFNVSTRTVNKSLKPLIRRGLIIPDGTRGILVNRAKNVRKSTGIVGVFYCGQDTLPAKSPLINRLKAVINRDGCNMLLMSMLEEEIYHDIDFWKTNWLDGYIFLYGSFDYALAADMKKHGIPFVSANRTSQEYGIHFVDFDNAGSLQQAVEYLMSQGHRKIAVDFRNFKMKGYEDYIHQEWSKLTKRYGIYRREYYHCGETEDDASVIQNARYFLGLEDIPTAVILWHPSAAIFAAEFKKAGVRAPQDTAFIEHNIGCNVDHKYPYINSDYGLLAEAIWNLFGKVMRNPALETVNKFIKCELKIPESKKTEELIALVESCTA
jgi:DNA-binding LacI/PurR family transcriptional regulator